jgi:hypothetical protein
MKAWNPGMMTLIGFAITVAYGYSVATVFGLKGMDFLWELATLRTHDTADLITKKVMDQYKDLIHKSSEFKIMADSIELELKKD